MQFRFLYWHMKTIETATELNRMLRLAPKLEKKFAGHAILSKMINTIVDVVSPVFKLVIQLLK